MDLWDALEITQPCIVACTGAGGKTSLLRSLTACAAKRYFPVILTTTTKMYYEQVEAFQPIVESSFSKGSDSVICALQKQQNQGCVAWVSSRDKEKVSGLPPEYIDQLVAIQANAYILIEADGAKERLLKTSDLHEPVIPLSTSLTIGVLSLRAIGKPLDEHTVHRLEQLCTLLGKGIGETIVPHDLALLACHGNGIFQYSRGRRVLVLTGAGELAHYGREIVEALRNKGMLIERCVFTEGYGVNMEVVEVHTL